MSIHTKKILDFDRENTSVIFYLGIPVHGNLGDLAQGVCIRNWLKNYYPEKKVIEIETNALVNTRFSVLKKLCHKYIEGDIIVFQSGYTTTDLGGFADEMHRNIIEKLPKAKMLMLPQTIYFKNTENEERTSKIYNSAENMLFLARDKVSYEKALNMFPNIEVKLFPDIVTTLIGQKKYYYERDGILFCCRNDEEKYYTDEQINSLMEQCSRLCNVSKTDTSKETKIKDIVKNAEEHIFKEIDDYAHYKLIVTDRYHGTILSLVAGTPVIIIKTTDHKVTTGALWFEGIYDDYVYLVDSLDSVYDLAEKILGQELSGEIKPYFNENYYSKLRHLFENN